MTIRNEIPTNILLDALISGILTSGDRLVIDGSFYSEIVDLVNPSSLEAKSPEQILCECGTSLGTRLLDFGCGTGGHRAFIESQGFEWHGLNYKEGMEVGAARAAAELQDERIRFYNGRDIPFPDSSFDIIYSFQTFEHIQHIDWTFFELKRILRPGGRLIGAVSYLEQIHDYSTFNFTPYGFKLAARQAGLRVERLYPRSDVFTFLLRRLLVVTSASDENSLTPSAHADNNVGRMLGEYAARHGDIRSANLLRLMFSTHFSFDAIRPHQAC